MPRPAPAAVFAVAASLLLSWAAPGMAEGKYSRRREARGDVTDTGPKLDTWAFFDDSKSNPRGLTLFADTYAARTSEGGLLPLVVGMGYEGTGDDLPVQPWNLRLAWEGGSATGLAFEQLRAIDGWQTTMRSDLRLLERRMLPFARDLTTRVTTSFYPYSPEQTWSRVDAKLPPGAYFADLVYFQLPEGVDPWTTLFTLSHEPCAPAPATVKGARPMDMPCDASVSTTLRIEPDPSQHQRAFRKARKDQRRDAKREDGASR